MADFKFTPEDLNSDDITSVMRREMSKGLTTQKPMHTTASRSKSGVKFGVFSLSEIMQGVPAISSGTESLSYQEAVVENLLTGSLLQHSEDESIEALNFQHSFAFLVPDDIKANAIEIGRSLTDKDREPILTVDASGNLILQPRDPASGNSNGVVAGGNIVDAYNVPTTVVDGRVKTDASTLLSMPNFLAGNPPGSATYEQLKSGKVKPELVRVLIILSQMAVFFSRGIYRGGKQNGNGPTNKNTNHAYYAAIDIFGFAYPDNPTQQLTVLSRNSDGIISNLIYPLLNSITGSARPDEIGGPMRLPTDKSTDGAFYQNAAHADHIHIGFNYDTPGSNPEADPPFGGEGGVRNDQGQNEVFPGIKTIPINMGVSGTGRVQIPSSVDMLEMAKSAGVQYYETSGWRSRSAGGGFQPVAIMCHHTAGPGPGSAPAASLNTVINGRSDVSGPLCNFLIGKDGGVHLIAAGKANGGGTGSSALLDRVKQDLPPTGNASSNGDISANQSFYHIEVENNGKGEPYPLEQLDALIKLCAAICLAHKWTSNRVVHHREWTSRKIDMSWQGDLRGSVRTKMLTASTNRGSSTRRVE